ncbi:hypothetical protein DAMA08_052020 [Martiniozyma asiatica (nom. inval.)]|nr:hypothetical protein DAMA08_052020 [Martiniozyma asiatica]
MPMFYKTPAEANDVLPPKIAPAAFLGDCMTTTDTDPEHTLTSGFYKQVAGEPLVYTYPFDEMKVCLEVKGEMIITDEVGTSIKPKRGDVLYFKKNSTITFEAIGEGSYGHFFYTGLKVMS